MVRTFELSGITIDCQDVEAVAAFWAALFDSDLRESLPGWRRLGPLTPGGPVLTFQPVSEAKHGKARLHLDLQVDDLQAAVTLVERLGGRSLNEMHEYDEGTVAVLADVEGNEFCLVWQEGRQQGSAAMRDH